MRMSKNNHIQNKNNATIAAAQTGGRRFLRSAILRGVLGVPLGIAIGYAITIGISLAVGDGRYYPVTPQLLTAADSELGAVILQTVLCALLGAVSAAASVVWDMERLSLPGQTVIYFAALSAALLPIAYFCQWMPHEPAGIAVFLLLYLGIFVGIWIGCWLSVYLRVKKMNQRIQEETQKKA